MGVNRQRTAPCKTVIDCTCEDARNIFLCCTNAFAQHKLAEDPSDVVQQTMDCLDAFKPESTANVWSMALRYHKAGPWTPAMREAVQLVKKQIHVSRDEYQAVFPSDAATRTLVHDCMLVRAQFQTTVHNFLRDLIKQHLENFQNRSMQRALVFYDGLGAVTGLYESLDISFKRAVIALRNCIYEVSTDAVFSKQPLVPSQFENDSAVVNRVGEWFWIENRHGTREFRDSALNVRWTSFPAESNRNDNDTVMVVSEQGNHGMLSHVDYEGNRTFYRRIGSCTRLIKDTVCFARGSVHVYDGKQKQGQEDLEIANCKLGCITITPPYHGGIGNIRLFPCGKVMFQLGEPDWVQCTPAELKTFKKNFPGVFWVNVTVKNWYKVRHVVHSFLEKNSEISMRILDKFLATPLPNSCQEEAKTARDKKAKKHTETQVRKAVLVDKRTQADARRRMEQRDRQCREAARVVAERIVLNVLACARQSDKQRAQQSSACAASAIHSVLVTARRADKEQKRAKEHALIAVRKANADKAAFVKRAREARDTVPTFKSTNKPSQPTTGAMSPLTLVQHKPGQSASTTPKPLDKNQKRVQNRVAQQTRPQPEPSQLLPLPQPPPKPVSEPAWKKQLRLANKERKKPTEPTSKAAHAMDCPVCFERFEEKHTLVPCGHLFCGPCAKELAKSKECAFCREPVAMSMRIFM